MNPIIAIKDDFLYYPSYVKNKLLEAAYKEYRLDIDGVAYPYINKEIPKEMQREIVEKIEALVGPIKVRYLFSRAMPKGVVAPNAVHSDIEMGTFSAHIYLSNTPGHPYGTSFWKHREHGFDSIGVSPSEIDSKHFAEWDKYLDYKAGFNSILIHAASAWHCAEPLEGFGESKEDWRLVITCFFDQAEQ